MDGTKLTRTSEDEDGIVAFYANLYKEPVEWRPKVDATEFAKEDRNGRNGCLIKKTYSQN